jgi:glycosyltransferase involved in cell wall biosynthesis
LRGLHARNFSAKVTARARTAGFRGEINFLLLVQSATILTLSSAHTLGPSLEKSTPRNRELCLTNKIFTCLLSGTPVLLTPTRAQQRLATDLGETALVVNFDRPADTAEKLDAWLASPSRRHAAARARALGLGRYNWDYEQASFLQTLRSTLAKSAS